jgi:Fe-Mn family superoxide dismutase
MQFTQEPLGYEFSDLEPYIDTQTMELHYGKHHAGYVTKLNAALEEVDIAEMVLEELLQNLDKIPEEKRDAINNNGFQHYNHAFFWKVMTPGGAKEPKDELMTKIEEAFVDFDKFKEIFSNTAATLFGSGWVWLYATGNELKIEPFSNEESPVKEKANTPLLCLDVWEHAYYLKYQNRRPEFIENWWNLVNWDIVSDFYSKR